MWNRVTDALRGLDQFGVIFQPTLRYKTKEYKTVLGGVMSILLYGLSLAYFIYYANLWLTNQLLPKVTSTSEIIQYQKFEMEDKFIQFQIRDQDNQKYDPFDPQAIIIQPMIYKFTNRKAPQKGFQMEFSKQGSQMTQVYFGQLPLSSSSKMDDQEPEITYMITFGACQTYFLPAGYKCASQDIVDNYFAQRLNALIINSIVKQYNSQTKELDYLESSYSIAINNKSTYYSQNVIQPSHVSMDDNILFEGQQDFYFAQKIDSISQQIEIDYFNLTFGYPVFMVYQISVGQIQQYTSIQYPKGNEILADTGSIVSLILLFQYVVIVFNQRFLEEDALNSIIQMYYPQFKQFIIKSNIFGKIQEINYQNKSIDVQKYKVYYDKLKNIAQEKLSVSNQIYELSRLQFCLQSNNQRDFIRQSHKQGIRIPNLYISLVKDESNKSLIPDHVSQIVQIQYIQLPKSNELESQLDQEEPQRVKSKMQDDPDDPERRDSQSHMENEQYPFIDEDYTLLMYQDNK